MRIVYGYIYYTVQDAQNRTPAQLIFQITPAGQFFARLFPSDRTREWTDSTRRPA